MSDDNQNAYYRKQATEAQAHADRAKSDDDKAAWLKLARDWLNLLPRREQTATEAFDTAETERGTHQEKSDKSH